MFTRIGHVHETGLGVVCLDTAADMDEGGKKIVGRVSEEGFDLAQGLKLRAGRSLKVRPVKGFTFSRPCTGVGEFEHSEVYKKLNCTHSFGGQVSQSGYLPPER